MRPEGVAAAIAQRVMADAAVVAAGLRSATYPAVGALPPLPALVLYWTGFDKADSMQEQIWQLTFLGRLFTSEANVPAAIAAVDALVVPIADVFDASLHQRNFTLDGAVSSCAVTVGGLNKLIPFAGKDYYGGELTFAAKLRRFAGGT